MAMRLTQKFDIARQAMSSLELFASHYASGTPTQEHLQKVIAIVEELGNSNPKDEAGENFFDPFRCSASEDVNHSGTVRRLQWCFARRCFGDAC